MVEMSHGVGKHKHVDSKKYQYFKYENKTLQKYIMFTGAQNNYQ